LVLVAKEGAEEVAIFIFGTWVRQFFVKLVSYLL